MKFEDHESSSFRDESFEWTLLLGSTLIVNGRVLTDRKPDAYTHPATAGVTRMERKVIKTAYKAKHKKRPGSSL